MTNHNDDNKDDQYINQKTRRPMEDWDKIEIDNDKKRSNPK